MNRLRGNLTDEQRQEIREENRVIHSRMNYQRKEQFPVLILDNTISTHSIFLTYDM